MPSGGRGGVVAGLGEDEGAGPERDLRGPGLPAAQPEQRRLLVAGGGARPGSRRPSRPRSRPSRRSAAAARAGRRTARAARRPSRTRRAGTAASGRRCRRRRRGRRRAGTAARTRRRRRRAPRRSTWSSTQRSFVAGKVASSSSPVRSRTNAACSRSAAHAASVRRSCQTIAGWTARPVARSQTTKVSVWLAMPSAATSAGRAPAPSIASTADATSASGSCSTSPGPGNEHATATEAEPRSRSSASSTTQRVLDVPWSRPRTSARHRVVPARRSASAAR